MTARRGEHDAEAPDRAPRPGPALPAPAQVGTGHVLALQRTAGNRATGQMLARRPTHVHTYARDGRYAVAGAYGVELDGIECRLTIRANIVKGDHVSDEELARVKAQTREAFLRFWDGKFIFTDAASHQDFFLRVDVVYTNSRPDTTIHLLQNRRDAAGNVLEGRDDQTTWYVHSTPNDRAHELSHQLGLRDEYIDPDVPNRRNAAARGVFQDHSLMGNYYDEGIVFAEVKLRHGQALARAIGRATHRRFTVQLSGPFQGERLLRWRRIWDRYEPGSDERTRAEAEIRAIEADMMLPQTAAAAGLPYTPQYSRAP